MDGVFFTKLYRLSSGNRDLIKPWPLLCLSRNGNPLTIRRPSSGTTDSQRLRQPPHVGSIGANHMQLFPLRKTDFTPVRGNRGWTGRRPFTALPELRPNAIFVLPQSIRSFTG